MADRIGVINKGEIILVEDKAELMHKLGKKQLTLELHDSSTPIPAALAAHGLTLGGRRQRADLHLRHRRASAPASPTLLDDLDAAGIRFKDLHTTQSSLEDIFVDLVRKRTHEPRRRPRDLPLRDGAHRAHAAAEHRRRR